MHATLSTRRPTAEPVVRRAAHRHDSNRSQGRAWGSDDGDASRPRGCACPTTHDHLVVGRYARLPHHAPCAVPHGRNKMLGI